ncbi:putative lysozyme-like protein [Clytia hemisphaerica]|uniref:Uncharacterized protein n=1 Tax=Clytia hemisphaerica TaxID=252671 RepID=A0A7M5V9C1_9CNID|eukprot:TCONS_00017639-protein
MKNRLTIILISLLLLVACSVHGTKHEPKRLVKKQFVNYGGNESPYMTEEAPSNFEDGSLPAGAEQASTRDSEASLGGLGGNEQPIGQSENEELATIMNAGGKQGNTEENGGAVLNEAGLANEGVQSDARSATDGQSNSQDSGLSNTISSLINQDTSSLEDGDAGAQGGQSEGVQLSSQQPNAEGENGGGLPSMNGFTGSFNSDPSDLGGGVGGSESAPMADGGGNGGAGGEDILSAFNEDPLGKKFESSVNLGDSTSSSFASQPDFSSMDAFKGGNSDIDKLLNSGYTMGDSSAGDAGSRTKAQEQQGKHQTGGDTKEDIGSKLEGVQDLLSKELSQLDTADEKLEKMLEGGIDSDSSSFTMGGNGMGGNGNAVGGGGNDMMGNAMQMDGMPSMGVGTSNTGGMGGQWNGADGFATQTNNQMANQYPDSPQQLTNLNDALGGQTQTANQQPTGSALSQTPQQDSLPQIQHTVVHQHASDKQGTSKVGSAHLSLAATKNAQKVHQDQQNDHNKKLVMLRQRLKLLDKKIVQLEDEQAKKSTSTADEHSPRKARNNAIKSLLIKNLKLAAMIATKEIQLEETKARSLQSSASERKEDSMKVTENDVADSTISDNDFLKDSKPLTELSRKAEEEVNHLTKNENAASKSNLLNAGLSKLNNSVPEIKNSNQTKDFISSNSKNTTTFSSIGDAVVKSKVHINETLAILDQSVGKLLTSKTNSSTSSNITTDAKKKSENVLKHAAMVSGKVSNMSNSTSVKVVENKKKSPAALSVGDDGMATLFTEMKEKAATARRRSTLHKLHSRRFSKKIARD